MNQNATIVKIFELINKSAKPLDVEYISKTLNLKYGTVMKYCKDLEDLDMLVSDYVVFYPTITCKNTNKPYKRKQIKKVYIVNKWWW